LLWGSVDPTCDSSLHIHPTSGHPRNFPEIHLVYKFAF
jgi:hypothetical protein